jgi:hypothetical protein
MLVVRSFCEVVIVGQLDRSPGSIRSIARARDVTYGLFSLLFVGIITFALVIDPRSNPLLEAERRVAESVRHNVLLELKTSTEDGRITAPTLPVILEKVQKDLRTSLRGGYGFVCKEIKDLRTKYADWTPIEKQPNDFKRQASENSNEALARNSTSSFVERDGPSETIMYASYAPVTRPPFLELDIE